jgi:hypothetical protein
MRNIWVITQSREKQRWTCSSCAEFSTRDQHEWSWSNRIWLDKRKYGAVVRVDQSTSVHSDASYLSKSCPHFSKFQKSSVAPWPNRASLMKPNDWILSICPVFHGLLIAPPLVQQCRLSQVNIPSSSCLSSTSAWVVCLRSMRIHGVRSLRSSYFIWSWLKAITFAVQVWDLKFHDLNLIIKFGNMFCCWSRNEKRQIISARTNVVYNCKLFPSGLLAMQPKHGNNLLPATIPTRVIVCKETCAEQCRNDKETKSDVLLLERNHCGEQSHGKCL